MPKYNLLFQYIPSGPTLRYEEVVFFPHKANTGNKGMDAAIAKAMPRIIHHGIGLRIPPERFGGLATAEDSDGEMLIVVEKDSETYFCVQIALDDDGDWNGVVFYDIVADSISITSN